NHSRRLRRSYAACQLEREPDEDTQLVKKSPYGVSGDKIRAGDRAPDATMLMRRPGGEEMRLFNVIQGGNMHTILVFVGRAPRDLESDVREMVKYCEVGIASIALLAPSGSEPQDLAGVGRFVDAGGHAYAGYEVGEDETMFVAVRPDGMIGSQIRRINVLAVIAALAIIAPMSASIVYGLLAITFLFIALHCSRNRYSAPLPPGPKSWPILGNMKDMKTEQLWLTTSEWAKKYGSVVYVHVLRQGIVYLNTEEAVTDLLEKRASIYSDKPNLVMAPELCGAGNMLVFTGYGALARRQRRLMSQVLNQNSIEQHRMILEKSAWELVNHMLTHPENCFAHIRRYAAGIVLKIVYGIEMQNDSKTKRLAPEKGKWRETNTESLTYLDLVERTTLLLANKITAGGGIWAVDMFPLLKHLPAWFPGAEFKHRAARWKETIDELRERPWAAAKRNIASGEAAPSFCSTFLGDHEKTLTEREELDVRDAANSMYTASMDTTAAVVSHFLLAMVHYPDVMRRAQQELDDVLGGDRLPTFADRERLPYLDAVFEESMRWGCPVPLGLPHSVMRDDVYQGMRIPKGSVIFANIWNILRDSNIYPDPDNFNPERFLDGSRNNNGLSRARQRDPRAFVFGFGWRRCPATHLVESSVWLLIATLIAAFDISKVTHPNSPHPVEPKVTYENCAFRTPSEFEVDIRPRPGTARNRCDSDSREVCGVTFLMTIPY
ncbi:hypothetical protein EW146_g8712, partial [Bondarzewia mesenterica]